MYIYEKTVLVLNRIPRGRDLVEFIEENALHEHTVSIEKHFNESNGFTALQEKYRWEVEFRKEVK